MPKILGTRRLFQNEPKQIHQNPGRDRQGRYQHQRILREELPLLPKCHPGNQQTQRKGRREGHRPPCPQREEDVSNVCGRDRDELRKALEGLVHVFAA